MLIKINDNLHGPCNHHRMKLTWSNTGERPHAHDVILEWNVDRDLVGEADYLVMSFKAKAWTFQETEAGLVYLSHGDESQSMNHLIHCEVSGDRGDPGKQRRRVANVSGVIVPIIDEKISFKLGAWGRGTQVKMELAGYLDEAGVYGVSDAAILSALKSGLG